MINHHYHYHHHHHQTDRSTDRASAANKAEIPRKNLQSSVSKAGMNAKSQTR
jgi:hypothetical protein